MPRVQRNLHYGGRQHDIFRDSLLQRSLVIRGTAAIKKIEAERIRTDSLFVGGVQITSNGANLPTELFADLEATQYVQHAVGRVSSGPSNTVSALRSSYIDVEELLAAMLNIAPVPEYTLTASSPSISISVTPNIGIEMGATTPVGFILSVNRGVWHGGVAFDANGQTADVSAYDELENTPTVKVDGISIGIQGGIFNPVTLTPRSLTSDPVIMTGRTVYNNYATPSIAPTKTVVPTITPSSIRPYAKVLVGGLSNDAPKQAINIMLTESNTERVYSDTQFAVVLGFTYDLVNDVWPIVRFPKRALNLYAWDNITMNPPGWGLLTGAGIINTEVSINGITYFDVRWTGYAAGDPVTGFDTRFELLI